MFTRTRRAHYLFAASLSGILGFHVGVWAVQLAPLAAGLGLDTAKLGAAVTVAAAAGLVTLFAGGPARRPRRATPWCPWMRRAGSGGGAAGTVAMWH